MTDPAVPFHVVTVCTHNRTRSVMMAELLRSILDERLGAGSVSVDSAGFGPPDIAAIPDAVDAMRRRGHDVSTHRSRQVDAAIVRSADLILTAERDHVIRIAAIDPAAFRRSMTLPEFVGSASRDPAGPDDLAAAWVQRLTAGRTAMGYLRDPIPEVDDPTGLPGRAFEAAVVALEAECSIAASILAGALGRSR